MEENARNARFERLREEHRRAILDPLGANWQQDRPIMDSIDRAKTEEALMSGKTSLVSGQTIEEDVAQALTDPYVIDVSINSVVPEVEEPTAETQPEEPPDEDPPKLNRTEQAAKDRGDALRLMNGMNPDGSPIQQQPVEPEPQAQQPATDDDDKQLSFSVDTIQPTPPPAEPKPNLNKTEQKAKDRGDALRRMNGLNPDGSPMRKPDVQARKSTPQPGQGDVPPFLASGFRNVHNTQRGGNVSQEPVTGQKEEVYNTSLAMDEYEAAEESKVQMMAKLAEISIYIKMEVDKINSLLDRVFY